MDSLERITRYLETGKLGPDSLWGKELRHLQDTLRKEQGIIEEVAGEVVEARWLIDKLTTICADTALALKGKPAPLTLHSWHDLAAVATELKSQYDRTQQWIPTSQEMPQQGALIVKRWKEGTVWAGVYHGGAKDSSFDEWYPLPK